MLQARILATEKLWAVTDWDAMRVKENKREPRRPEERQMTTTARTTSGSR